MKNTTLTIFIVGVLLFLVGCGTTYKIGKEFNVNEVSKLKIGITTQEEVIGYFGNPLRKGISNGNEVYIYTREDIIFEHNDHVTREGNTLVIEFDANKKVKNYYLNYPGKETLLFGYLLHNRENEKEEKAAQHNQMIMQPTFH